jgi:hypothetical protein
MRTVRICAIAAAVALLAACGGSSKSPTDGGGSTPPTTLAACTQAILHTGQGTLPASVLDMEPFNVASAGRLDVTVDWTAAASPIGVYVVAADSCSLEGFNARSCNFLIRSEPSSAKPRKLSIQVAAGSYHLLLANFAEADESLSFQVVLSQGSCTPIASTPAAASTAAPRNVKALGHF